jgi:hypothetical protein
MELQDIVKSLQTWGDAVKEIDRQRRTVAFKTMAQSFQDRVLAQRREAVDKQIDLCDTLSQLVAEQKLPFYKAQNIIRKYARV